MLTRPRPYFFAFFDAALPLGATFRFFVPVDAAFFVDFLVAFAFAFPLGLGFGFGLAFVFALDLPFDDALVVARDAEGNLADKSSIVLSSRIPRSRHHFSAYMKR